MTRTASLLEEYGTTDERSDGVGVKIIAACQTAVPDSVDNEMSACGSVDTTTVVSIPSLFQNIMCEFLGILLNFANDSLSFYV